jgi:PTS system mannose-specific IID component
MNTALPLRAALLSCFLRTYLVGAAFNLRGMQNVGLILAMEPGLRAIYPAARDRQRARKRYLRHYNTHPFWTPLLVGIFLSLEEKIARGLFPAQVLDNVKNTTTYTLSAIGDSVFGGSLLVFWSLSTACLAVAGQIGWAVAWAVAWFVGLQAFKAFTFLAGLREGLKFLERLKRWGLINWGQRLKVVNALLLTLFLYLAWPGEFVWNWWLAVTGALGATAWLIARIHVSREVVALILLAIYVGYPWMVRTVEMLLENGLPH